MSYNKTLKITELMIISVYYRTLITQVSSGCRSDTHEQYVQHKNTFMIIPIGLNHAVEPKRIKILTTRPN
jgi:hypothetical protein